MSAECMCRHMNIEARVGNTSLSLNRIEGEQSLITKNEECGINDKEIPSKDGYVIICKKVSSEHYLTLTSVIHYVKHT